jgi:hypothetical protein
VEPFFKQMQQHNKVASISPYTKGNSTEQQPISASIPIRNHQCSGGGFINRVAAVWW